MAKKKREILKHPKNSIFELGYGQIPKKVMMDKRLSVEAKAIYAYFCSYCGGGNTYEKVTYKTKKLMNL
jgi:hypothetical protein